MALLNYGKTLSQLVDLNYLKKSGESGYDNKKYLELVFSNDGHIITHGQDYLKDFVSGKRGLVPDYAGVNDFGVLGKNGWTKLTTNYLPIYTTGDYTTDTILNSQQVKNLISSEISSEFKLLDVMQFKGGIASAENIPVKDYQAGWTYKITKSGNFLGENCIAGDLLIAQSDAESTQTAINTSHWFVVHTDTGETFSQIINGNTIKVEGYIPSSDTSSYTFYAPTEAGTAGQILKSTGGTPEWIDLSSIKLNQLGWFEKFALNSNIKGQLKLTHTLPDGTETTDTIGTLAKTSTDAFGVVKIGDNITVDGGTISLTSSNILKALGYVSLPKFVTSITLTAGTGITISDSGKAITDTGTRTITLKTASTSSIGGIQLGYQTSGPDRNYAVQLQDSKAFVNVPWIAYSVMTGASATSNGTSGLVPQPEAGKQNRFLKGDGTWATPSNTTYTFTGGDNKFTVTPSDGDSYDVTVKIINNVTYTGSIADGSIAVFNGTAGVVKSITLANLVTQKYITETLGNYYAKENTWRDIQVAGTSIGNKKLNFVPAGSIAIVTNPSDQVPGTTDTFDVGFDLYWWNLDDGQFEH